MTGANRPCHFCLSRRVQHVLDKNAVAPGGVIDQHMGHCSHNAAILQNWAIRSRVIAIRDNSFLV